MPINKQRSLKGEVGVLLRRQKNVPDHESGRPTVGFDRDHNFDPAGVASLVESDVDAMLTYLCRRTKELRDLAARVPSGFGPMMSQALTMQRQLCLLEIEVEASAASAARSKQVQNALLSICATQHSMLRCVELAAELQRTILGPYGCVMETPCEYPHNETPIVPWDSRSEPAIEYDAKKTIDGRLALNELHLFFPLLLSKIEPVPVSGTNPSET